VAVSAESMCDWWAGRECLNSTRALTSARIDSRAFIAISPWSTGGKVSHRYSHHVSILKFVERNWRLPPLTERSRDNLPNPRATQDNP
jgi:Phosphoesterase family